MVNADVILRVIILVFLLSICREVYSKRVVLEPFKAYSICLKHGMFLKIALYFLAFCSVINIIAFFFSSSTFILTDLIDRILIACAIFTVLYCIPKKIYISKEDITYMGKHWLWDDIKSVDVYSNVLDILFSDCSRKLIYLEQPTAKEKEELLELVINNKAMI